MITYNSCDSLSFVTILNNNKTNVPTIKSKIISEIKNCKNKILQILGTIIF